MSLSQNYPLIQWWIWACTQNTQNVGDIYISSLESYRYYVHFAIDMNHHSKPGKSSQKALLWRDLLGLTLQTARLHRSLETLVGGKCTLRTVLVSAKSQLRPRSREIGPT